jgi:uncharacterized protein
MRMRPLSVAERSIQTQTVSLAALLRGNRDVGGATALRLTDYVKEITASGFPPSALCHHAYDGRNWTHI